jgi:hypothetical protein
VILHQGETKFEKGYNSLNTYFSKQLHFSKQSYYSLTARRASFFSRVIFVSLDLLYEPLICSRVAWLLNSVGRAKLSHKYIIISLRRNIVFLRGLLLQLLREDSSRRS